MSMNLYVGNIPYTLSEEELKELFVGFGSVDSAKIIFDRESRRSKGFGFVEMTNREDGEKAIENLNQSTVGGRTIIVNEARPRKPRRDSE